jgi:surface carbohydrate biosynthesis protein
VIKKNLFIPLEVKSREFVSNLLLASESLDNNFRCYIGAKSSINRLINYNKSQNGVYFSKSPFLEKEYIKIKKKCQFFTILDQELGPALSKHEIEMGLAARKNLILPKYIDSYFVIGNRINEIVKKIYPEINKAIKLTGWPRIDIWKNYNYLYNKKSNEIKNKYGDFILFSSDFSFLTKKNIQNHLDYLKSYDHKENDQSYIYAKKRAEIQYQEFRKALKLFIILDKLDLKNKIIIRPHPAEDHIYWNKMKKKFKKIKVIFEGDISEWLYACNGLMHRGCTTGVQAYISNIPTAYIITDEKNTRETLTFDVSQKINGLEEVKNFINNPKNFNEKINKKIFDEHILSNDNSSASHMIIKDLLTLDIRQVKKINLNFFDQIKEFVSGVKTEIRNKNIKIFKKFGQGINVQETTEYLKLIRKKYDFKVVKIYKNCLMIEKN